MSTFSDSPAAAPASGNLVPGLRPQTVVMAVFGLYGRGTRLRVSSATLIRILGSLGISEDAVRTTLARMTKRGMLERQRQGRQMYFGVSAYAESVLESGAGRVFRRSAVDDEWAGDWTMVTYSLPEPSRALRAELRAKLGWAGFGRVQPGVWVSPERADVHAILDGLEANDFINVFRSVPQNGTTHEQLLELAFDLPGIRATFEGFLRRRAGHEPFADISDPMLQQIILHTDWLGVIRHTPTLPSRLLPDDWPARSAETLFHELDTNLTKLVTLPDEDWIREPAP